MAARAALEVAAAAAARDVVLYEHDRGRFFRLVGLFCAGQGLFWAYLAHFAFTALRPVPGPAAGADDPLRPRDNKWRFGFTASCLTVGTERAGPGPGGTGGVSGDTPGSHRGHTRGRGRAPGLAAGPGSERGWGGKTGTEPG